ncbi:glutathione S-transferase family protein [Ahrensia marina]|uniref:glutathione S-transferase family protein n=1 Tax=Ahrensia marina TaxID=1514904 RepID=UPI0035D0ED04
MHTLYSMQNSGNCYKLRLAMAQLSIPFEIHDVDILKGESRTPEFLALNPNGKVPALRLKTGQLLSESNAILFFLAEDTPLMPEGKFCRAEVLQWMFFEQYSHEPYIAVARFWLKLMKGGRELKRDMLDDWWERGYEALGVMERHLETHDFFAAGQYSIADIALYAYTHVAGDGEFDLSDFPGINAWMTRVQNQPGHVAMDWRP